MNFLPILAIYGTPKVWYTRVPSLIYMEYIYAKSVTHINYTKYIQTEQFNSTRNDWQALQSVYHQGHHSKAYETHPRSYNKPPSKTS